MTTYRVTAPSRLHFGLLSLPSRADAAAAMGVRHFGGVGLMIEGPGVEVEAARAAAWSAAGPCAERALAFAQRLIATLPETERGAYRISVRRCAPEHVGLGTGTQLGLAVARSVALADGHSDWGSVELARRIGRGLRSGIGVHGFERGGLLIDAGKRPGDAVGTLAARLEFPDDWRVLVAWPRGRQGEHGDRERAAFDWLRDAAPEPRRGEALCRLALLGMLPALLERDLATFGAALHEFNRRAGEWFEPWQGGPYSSRTAHELIDWLRQQGIRGAGQSSWGPAVFAIERGELLERVAKALPAEVEVIVTGACNLPQRVPW
jgi:beta-RFAP synthase